MEKTLQESKDFIMLQKGLEEWCGDDLDPDSFAGCGPSSIIEEAIKCFVYACAMDSQLNDALKRLVFNYRSEVQSVMEEE
jgi:hypothetical protein